MHMIESELDVYELHRQVVLAEDSQQRAEAIGILRGLIEEEHRKPHSGMDRSYLRVAEMVLEILEQSIPAPEAII